MTKLHAGNAGFDPTEPDLGTLLTTSKETKLMSHDTHIDLEAIDLKARRLRAQYLASFFKRRSR